MNFDDIEKMWRSPQNALSPAGLARQKTELEQKLRREYRGFLIVTGAGSIWLLLCVGAFLRYLASGGAFELQREWGAVVLFALPLFAAVLFFRQYYRHRTAHAGYGGSIAATVRALLDENRLAQTRIKVIGAMYVIMTLLAPLIVNQLLEAGKVRPREVASMAVVFGAIVLIGGGGLVWEFRRNLRPRQRELQTILQSYESSD